MTGTDPSRWHPTSFRRFVKAIASSTQVVQIITDAGEAYLKPMSSHVSPHKLACELLGTQLAAWLGLATFEFDVLRILPDDEIPLKAGGYALPGPGFVTRAHRGIEWSGSRRLLGRLDNPEDISRLVVFDTWTLNWDRHAPPNMNRRPRPDNVFLTSQNAKRGRFRLVAMDQTECFALGPELSRSVATIGRIQDDRVFGLFPAFIARMNREVVRKTARRMARIDRPTVAGFLDFIPREWEVSDRLRKALADLIVGRARFLADRIEAELAPVCWPQQELDFGEGSKK